MGEDDKPSDETIKENPSKRGKKEKTKKATKKRKGRDSDIDLDDNDNHKMNEFQEPIDDMDIDEIVMPSKRSKGRAASENKSKKQKIDHEPINDDTNSKKDRKRQKASEALDLSENPFETVQLLSQSPSMMKTSKNNSKSEVILLLTQEADEIENQNPQRSSLRDISLDVKGVHEARKEAAKSGSQSTTQSMNSQSSASKGKSRSILIDSDSDDELNITPRLVVASQTPSNEVKSDQMNANQRKARCNNVTVNSMYNVVMQKRISCSDDENDPRDPNDDDSDDSIKLR